VTLAKFPEATAGKPPGHTLALPGFAAGSPDSTHG
jgi:hypothetical protein